MTATVEIEDGQAECPFCKVVCETCYGFVETHGCVHYSHSDHSPHGIAKRMFFAKEEDDQKTEEQ